MQTYQSGERLNGIQEVSGSIPLISTKQKIHWNLIVPMDFCVSYLLPYIYQGGLVLPVPCNLSIIGKSSCPMG